MASESSNFPKTTNETEEVRAFRAALDDASFDDASAKKNAATGCEPSCSRVSTGEVAADAPTESSSISVVLPIIKSDSDGERGSASGRTFPRRDGRAPVGDETTTGGSSAQVWNAREFEGERTVVSNEPPMDCGRGLTSSDNENGPEGSPNDLKNGGALPPGTRFGHFVVSKYIGGGGMGRVYEGVDAALDRKVAIKVLPRQRARDQGTVARFLNEAKSAARLNHEHIAQVYFCGEENGVPYIAFEYVSGTNLRDYVRERGVLELGEAINYVLQAAGALAHAAAHGVTHRDVKPSNIIVTPQKNAKLIDMGLARLLKTDVADDLTESGVTLGTFDYISPEQARDPRVADVRSDIYSLGCSFYYMLVGTPPFPDGTVLQKLLQHQGDEAPDVREANPTVPVEVAAVLKKMMKKNPDERYQTPDALIADLFEIAEMIGLRLSERNVASVDAQEKKAPTATLRRLPGVCAIVFFLGAVSVFYWSTRDVEVRLPVVEVASPPATLVGGGARVPGEIALPESASPVVEPTSQAAPSASFVEGSAAVSGVSPTGPVGEILDVAALDSLYASRAADFERAPVLSVDDGREWRRVYLSGSASVAASRRVAAGWRARPLVDSNVGFDVLFARGRQNDAASAGVSTGRAAFAYSFLGVSADVSPQDVPATNATRTVDRVGSAPQTFASLQSALSGVRDGSAPLRVELKFNGTLETPPISLVGAKVEIVAAEGFRPTLLFKPPETPNGGWGERMFLLSDCDLTLDGVSVDFTVPSQEVVASKWSVFETLGATSLTIRNATLTVCNSPGETFVAPLHSNVALFRSTSRLALDESTAPTAVANDSSVAPVVRLKNVFARCEATVWTSDRLDGELYAEFSGFNASGPIVQIGEAESDADEAVGARSERSRFLLNFDRVVAVGRSSLARFEEGAASAASIPFDVSLTNSIVRLDSAPLSVVSSSRPLEEGAAPGSDWKLDGSLLLDVSSFCQTRLRRTSQFSDAPVPKELAFDAKTLSELNADAPARLAEIAPHLFGISDFSRWILNPVRTSTAIGDLLRANAEEIKTNFVDVAAE